MLDEILVANLRSAKSGNAGKKLTATPKTAAAALRRAKEYGPVSAKQRAAIKSGTVNRWLNTVRGNRREALRKAMPNLFA